MMAESELLLKSFGLQLQGLDTVYLQVLEIIGAIRNRRQNYTKTKLDKVKLKIFWKTIKEIADQEIKDEKVHTTAAINHVLDAFPDKKKKTDGRMWLPLHFAMSIPDIDLDDIQILFCDNPESIVQGSNPESNYTPCHLAMLTRDPHIDLIKKLREFDAGFGVRRTRYESTALHLAAEFSNSIPAIQELIREFPAALTMRDDCERVPIACVFENNTVAAPDIFRTLLQAAPQTVTEPDSKGRLLIHQCFDYNSADNLSSQEITSIMLEAFPGVVNISTIYGWLPIHHAANDCGSEVLKLVTEANPANLSAMAPGYGNAAHFAARRINVDNLLYIHYRMPELLLSVNAKNRTPLACSIIDLSDNLDFIEAVASLEPAAARIVDSDEDNVLHMLFKCQNLRRTVFCDILRLFIRLIPGGAIAINNQGQTPYDLLDADDPVFDYARRLLLLAGAPSLHPETRQQMNYQARKGALLAFFAPRGGEHQSGGEGLDICHRIRHGAGAIELMREIVSFL